MNLNQPTLIQFEQARKALGIIPPKGSNSFYEIGKGEINIYGKSDDPENYLFDLFTNKGEIYTGPGNFIISKDNNSESPYENLTVIEDTILHVNNNITIQKGKCDVHGTLDMMPNSRLYAKNGGVITLYSHSTLVIGDNSTLIIEGGSKMMIYGKIDIHISVVNTLLTNPRIIIDSAAVMNVTGMELLGERSFSLTDYDSILRQKIIKKYTQGEVNFEGGRLGYTWKDGDPLQKSQILTMSLLYGECPLGDFKFSVLGNTERLVPNLQIINNFEIKSGTTLYISEEYNGYRYMYPQLYLGIIISNNKVPAKCIVDGTIIVDGSNASIILDRGASLYINKKGSIYLKNNSKFLSTNNNEHERILFIDGTLVIDSIEQISTFSHDNIVLGETAKVVILNPDTGERKLLFNTPNGIKNTDLYRLFEDRIDNVEYHIHNNNGIGIDKYYDFFGRDFKKWYGGRRIEKAIHDGILVWHDGAFIELRHDIIPWVNEDCTLFHASRLFKSFGSYDNERLQEVVDRLKYAGCGNILFRFINEEKVSEVIMVLDGVKMESVLSNAGKPTYTLNTDGDGILFIKNNLTSISVENIVNSPTSKRIDIENNKVEFTLP